MILFSCSSVRWNKIPSLEALGNFELLLDEEIAAQDDTTHNRDRKNQQSTNRWK